MKITALLVFLLIGICASAQRPVVESFSPRKGDAGSSITIVGSGFASDVANNSVFFGSVKAKVVTANETKITVTVPYGSTFGSIRVFNNFSKLYGSSVEFFTPVFPTTYHIAAEDFSNKTEVTTSVIPRALISHDLDGDGKPEVIAVSYETDEVVVFQNNTRNGNLDGNSFGQAITFKTGKVPFMVKVADLDNDCKPDLLVANSMSNTVSVFRNTSTTGIIDASSFAPGVEFTSGINPVDLITCDLNNDGKLDIVTANTDGRSISIFNNQSVSGSISTSSFADKIDIAINERPSSLAAADLNGDRGMDLVVMTTATTGFTVLQHKFSGNGVLPIEFLPAKYFLNSYMSTGVNIADVNHDGKPDVLISNREELLSVKLNQTITGANSAIDLDIPYYVPNVRQAANVNLADIDGDGLLEVITGGFGITILKDVRQRLTENGFNQNLISIPNTFLSIADLDLDGKPDILIGNSQHSFVILKNNPPQHPVIQSFYPISGDIGTVVKITGRNFNKLAVKNIVRFGQQQAVVRSASTEALEVLVPAGFTAGAISVLDGESGEIVKSTTAFTTTFKSKNSINNSDFHNVEYAASGQNANLVKVADLDHDGKLEMIYADYSLNYISIVLTDNPYKLNYVMFDKQIHLPISGNPLSLNVEDLDGDGLLDLLVTYEKRAEAHILRNTSVPGKISFAPKEPIGQEINILALGDLNSDGKTDLVTDRVTNFLRSQSSAGSFIFQQQNAQTYGSSDGQAFADFDGDGRPDQVKRENNQIFFQQNISYNRYVFLAPPFKLLDAKGDILLEDINKDGACDVVVIGETSIYVLLNANKGIGPITLDSFLPAQELQGADGVTNVSIIDMDGDGKPDLTGINKTKKSVYVFKNISVGNKIAFEPHVELQIPTEPLDLAVGDINNDNTPDIVVAANQLYLFLNEPKVLFAPVISSIPPHATPGSSVQIVGDYFNTDASRNKVFFDGINAKITSVSKTNITAVVPAYAVLGKISVLNLDNNLTGYSAQKFSTSFSGRGFFSEKDFVTAKLMVKHPYSDTHDLFFYDMFAAGFLDMMINLPLSVGIYPFTSYYLDQVRADEHTVLTGVYTDNLLLSDIDGNGNADILLDKPLTVFNFQSTNSISFYKSFSAPAEGTIAVLKDIDGDGRPDILKVAGDGDPGTPSFRIQQNLSKGIVPAFGSAIVFDVSAANAPGTMAAEDLDADGKPDIILLDNSRSGISVLKNTALPGGISKSSLAAPLNFPLIRKARLLRCEDINGDGLYDIIVLNADGSLTLLKNNSVGSSISFAAPKYIETALKVSDFDIGDLNGDGFVDLALLSADGKIVLYSNNESRIWVQTGAIYSGGETLKLKIADINGDGKPDLVTRGAYGVWWIKNSPSVYPILHASANQFTVNKSQKIDAALTIEYDSKLTSASIVISKNFNPAQDQLLIPSEIMQAAGIAGSFDTSTGILSLKSVNASAAVWANILRSVTYNNSNLSPSPDSREITIEVANNDLVSNKLVLTANLISAPILTSYSPKISGKGSTITISGTGFNGVEYVHVGGTAVSSFKVISSTLIEAVLGDGGSGEIEVKNPVGTGTAQGFTYIEKPILSAVGSAILLSGKNLTLAVNTGTQFIYKWERDGMEIPNATGNSLTITAGGRYTVTLIAGSFSIASNSITINTVYYLPNTNFKLSAVGVTCKDSKNGIINLTAVQELDYQVKVSLAGDTTSYAFTKQLSIHDLAPGNYSVCISTPKLAYNQQYFNVVVTAPKELTLYSSVNRQEGTVLLQFSGGDTYHINLNGKIYNTSGNQITLQLAAGANILRLSSDKTCQGFVEEKFILVSKLQIYPNPVDDLLNLSLPTESNEPRLVEVFDVSGRRVYKMVYDGSIKQISFSVADLQGAMYILRVTSGLEVTNSKFLKR